MKCEPTRDGDCKRCRNNKTECIYKPRANARQHVAVPPTPYISTTNPASPEVLARLAIIESILGINRDHDVPHPVAEKSPPPGPLDAASTETDSLNQDSYGLSLAITRLRKYTEPHQQDMWSRDIVSQLWLSFHTNMESLHFQSEKQTLSNPTPLLLVAILYVSALLHSSRSLTALAPSYFHVLCKAIAELSIPEALHPPLRVRQDQNPSLSLNVQQDAFQNVLGLILAGLTSEALISLTGIWISIGYRLVLDHCPVYTNPAANRWRQLFAGLQIIDLEHASLHLSCTVVPVRAPLPSLRQLQAFADDPFHKLTIIMHTGLSHFAGRGLPTIWSAITSTLDQTTAATLHTFTDIDAQMIKGWARDLDDWLISSERSNTSTAYDRVQMRRQYNLHRLLVLSIYHPARGFDLFADVMASRQQYELLLSARATLALWRNDPGIWANWDLVIITWAAIIVLQGVEGGAGEQEDLTLVQCHIDKLRKARRPEPSLHSLLASRVEVWQRQTTVPSTTSFIPFDLDPSWSLFDQANMDSLSDTYAYYDDPISKSSMQGSAGSPQSPQNLERSVDRQHRNAEANESWVTYTNPTGTWPFGLDRVFGSTTHPMTDAPNMRESS
ncbi:hypothetical protein DE146DRAFT_288085 [Phaeosphaeria sp. MPI-PUGE-AT-0046c]|nr:hypothetical protein DE146DRAFT_288085 [Phaeosphaeria sp. MPI-PUGE-AT-0046c]